LSKICSPYLSLTSPPWVLPIYKKVYKTIHVLVRIYYNIIVFIPSFTIRKYIVLFTFNKMIDSRWRRDPLEISHHLFFLLWRSINYLTLSIQLLSSLGLLFKVSRKYTKGMYCVYSCCKFPSRLWLFFLPIPEIWHFSFQVFQMSISVQLFWTRVDYRLFIKFEKLVKSTLNFKYYGLQYIYIYICVYR